MSLYQTGTTGIYLDPFQSSTLILEDLKTVCGIHKGRKGKKRQAFTFKFVNEYSKLCHEFEATETILKQTVTWRRYVGKTAPDIAFVKELGEALHTRKDLWKFYDVTSQHIQDWKNTAIGQLNLKKIDEKLAYWTSKLGELKTSLVKIAAAQSTTQLNISNQLRSRSNINNNTNTNNNKIETTSVTNIDGGGGGSGNENESSVARSGADEDDKVWSSWREVLNSFKFNLKWTSKLADSGVFSAADFVELFSAIGLVYEASRAYTMHELIALKVDEHIDLIASIHKRSYTQAKYREQLEAIRELWSVRVKFKLAKKFPIQLYRIENEVVAAAAAASTGAFSVSAGSVVTAGGGGGGLVDSSLSRLGLGGGFGGGAGTIGSASTTSRASRRQDAKMIAEKHVDETTALMNNVAYELVDVDEMQSQIDVCNCYIFSSKSAIHVNGYTYLVVLASRLNSRLTSQFTLFAFVVHFEF